MPSQTADPAQTTMDTSQQKIATDTQDIPRIQNQPASDHSSNSSNSSSSNDSPDPSSHLSQSYKLQTSSKSSKATVIKNTAKSIEITEATSTMLNAPQSDRKSSTSITNAISSEEEPRMEITGRLIIVFFSMIYESTNNFMKIISDKSS